MAATFNNEAAFKQMIATFIRQTRPRLICSGKLPRCQHRPITTVKEADKIEDDAPRWRNHRVQAAQPLKERSRIDALRNEQEPRTFSSFLTDNFSRQHNYLRISVTERCNLRCVYCMPEEGVPLSPVSHNLTSPEIVYLSELFVKQGVDKIRLTGGEPTVRKDIVELMQQIGELRRHGLKELCITSNGISLHRKLDAMVESGLTGVNLSLDTLDPFQFTLMTRRKGHDAVMKSIDRILEMNRLGAGIKLKINCVVMRGINEREIIPFVELGKEKDLEVRFIEYMPFDGNKWSEGKMLTFQEMLAVIESKYPDVHKVQGHANDTSKTYQIPGFRGRTGFITSMTHNFCGTCNRLRITSDGNLKVCLFGNEEVSLRDILRESNDGRPIDAQAMEALRQIEMNRREGHDSSGLGTTQREARLLDVIGMAVKQKKEKHAGLGELENMKNRPMILIDGPQIPPLLFPAINDKPLQPRIPAVASIYNKPLSASPRIPFHLLQHPRSSFIQSQQRYRSTFLGQRAFAQWRRVRYTTPFPGLRWKQYIATQDQFGIDVRAVKFRRRVEAVKEGLVGARLCLGFRPSSRAKSDKAAADHSPAEGAWQIRKVPYTSKPVIEGSDKKTDSIAPPLTHLTRDGSARMVNISDKTPTKRIASAVATLFFSDSKTFHSLAASSNVKGDAMAVARVAAIQAVKRTAELIPLAHPSLSITGVDVNIRPFAGTERSSLNIASKKGKKSAVLSNLHGGVSVRVRVECQGKTGIEMEAITGATIGAVTLYDMLKAVDKAMVIDGVRVIEKKGGKSGDWVWHDKTASLKPDTTKVAKVASKAPKPSSHSTQGNTPETSDVDEWNQGLANEFSINYIGGSDRKNPAPGQGHTPTSSTNDATSPPQDAVKSLPAFPLYRSKHLVLLRSQELRKIDQKYKHLVLVASSLKQTMMLEHRWNSELRAIKRHYARLIHRAVQKAQSEKQKSLKGDSHDQHVNKGASQLSEVKEYILAKQGVAKEDPDGTNFKSSTIEGEASTQDETTVSLRESMSEKKSQQTIDTNDFVESARHRYDDYLNSGLVKTKE